MNQFKPDHKVSLVPLNRFSKTSWFLFIFRKILSVRFAVWFAALILNNLDLPMGPTDLVLALTGSKAWQFREKEDLLECVPKSTLLSLLKQTNYHPSVSGNNLLIYKYNCITSCVSSPRPFVLSLIMNLNSLHSLA